MIPTVSAVRSARFSSDHRHMPKYLVTGTAGFIGCFVAKAIAARGDQVVGVDNVNDYYSVSLKRDRLQLLEGLSGCSFHEMDLSDQKQLSELFEREQFDIVVHLAAQAGVRYSLENPHAYVDSNLVGFMNILEGCRHQQVRHLVYASSSSVYGANTKRPFSVHDNVDHPLSLYAASKKANELKAHTYSHLFSLPTTGLRFFTVYGPWGRPDMALFKFTDAMAKGRPIDVYNFGKMQRDFTYIDDIVEGVVRVSDRVPEPNPDWNGSAPDPGTSSAPYKIYNIGNNQPVELSRFIEAIEKALGVKAQRNLLPMQHGDVPATYADIDDLIRDVGFHPQTSIEDGVARFVEWYRRYYSI